VDDVELVNFPAICPEEPLKTHGSLFCERHAGVAIENSIPTKRPKGNIESTAIHVQGKAVSGIVFIRCHSNHSYQFTDCKQSISRHWI
jgi:hypothetical protein